MCLIHNDFTDTSGVPVPVNAGDEKRTERACSLLGLHVMVWPIAELHMPLAISSIC